jgi:hypothetical protein
MKIKATEKVVCMETAVYSDKTFYKDNIYLIGEICHQHFISPNGRSIQSILDLYGSDYEIEFKDEDLEEIYKKIKPLSLIRQERIDKILEE